MSIAQTYTIVAEESHTVPARLDTFLTQAASLGYSRSYYATRIKSGDVTVNGVVTMKPSHEIIKGDEVGVQIPLPPEYDVEAQPVEFEVVAVEPDFIIVNKPAGLVVHHSHTKPSEPTLVHGLVHTFKELAEFTDQERPGIVHRLDKDTSGLLLIARSQRSQATLSELFKQRAITKQYSAIVCGHTDRDGEIDLPIGRHPIHRYKMKVDGINARDSITRYTVDRYLPEHTVVNVSLVTGRTHQIRVHFAAEKHALLGDSTYGKSTHIINRQALHAQYLSFEYDGHSYSYSVPIPQDMSNAIAKLTQ